MNNSFNVDLNEDFREETRDETPLREREAKLVRLIEVFDALSRSAEWSSLKQELFDGALESIESRMRDEARKPEVSLPALYRLQGERTWAKRYSDPVSYVSQLTAELAAIRKQLNPPGPTG